MTNEDEDSKDAAALAAIAMRMAARRAGVVFNKQPDEEEREAA